MAKRFTSSEKWDKLWFQELPPRLKCFWQYITERCDVAGVWEINYRLASFLIGEDVSEDDLTAYGDKVELLGDDKLWVVGYVKFQQTTLSRKCPAQKPVFALLEKHGLLGKIEPETVKGSATLAGRVTVRVTDRIAEPTPYPTSNSNSNSNKNKVSNSPAKAAEIIDHLNTATGSGFSSSAVASVSSISARLDEKGVTVKGIKQMIDTKVAEWGEDEKMQRYLRPKTLFSPENFSNYYGQKGKPNKGDFGPNGLPKEIIKP